MQSFISNPIYYSRREKSSNFTFFHSSNKCVNTRRIIGPVLTPVPIKSFPLTGNSGIFQTPISSIISADAQTYFASSRTISRPLIFFLSEWREYNIYTFIKSHENDRQIVEYMHEGFIEQIYNQMFGRLKFTQFILTSIFILHRIRISLQ